MTTTSRVARDSVPLERSARPGGLWRDPVAWLLVVGALTLRVGYNLALHQGGHPLTSFVIDEREYFGAAHMLAEGRGFSFFDTALWIRAPAYVSLLAGLIWIWGSAYVPILAAQSVLSALSILPLAWIADRISGRRAARLTAGLAAAYLPFTLFAGLLLSETLFVLLFCLAVVALVLAGEGVARGDARAMLQTGLAGLLLGLATLTRSTALGFVPLAVLWLAWQGPRPLRDGRAWVAGALMAAVCLGSLVPWSALNYASYHRLVLVDTTSGYNLWLGSVGVRDEPRLQADLMAIANPVDRQSFAYEQAWTNIADDPAAFVRKGVKESLDLWKPLFSAEERQVKGYTLGRTPAWHLISLFALDDLLYAIILLLSTAGLILSRRHALKWLTGLWVLLWVAMSFVFFAVTRFNLPVVALLIPWAGAGAVELARARSLVTRVASLPLASKAGALLVAAGVIVLVLPNTSPDAVILGTQRWVAQGPYREGERLLSEGQARSAAQKYVLADRSIADTRYGLAAAQIELGDLAAAKDTLVAQDSPERYEPLILRGELARLSGDLASARSYFNSRQVNLAGPEALDWAWDHLRPPRVTALEIGGGLDIGYIRGFYSPESDARGNAFRWSSEDASVRVLVPATSEAVKWSGWRPGVLPAASVILTGQFSQSEVLPRGADWHVTDLDPGEQTRGDTGLKVNAFVPLGSDPRLLGVRVSRIGASK